MNNTEINPAVGCALERRVRGVRILRALSAARKRHHHWHCARVWWLEAKLIEVAGLHRNLGDWDSYMNVSTGWKSYSRAKALEDAELLYSSTPNVELRGRAL